jgi:CMP-N-acetylneuraminic acid synthetase
MFPSVHAITLLRDGSVGVRHKNRRFVGRDELWVRNLKAVLGVELIDHLWLSTDMDEVLGTEFGDRVRVDRRPERFCDPMAPSELVVLELIDRIDPTPDWVVLTQCTSPFLTSDEIEGGLGEVWTKGADAGFAAVPFGGFVYDDAGNALTHSNDGPRPPRQLDKRRLWLETGAFYVMRTEKLYETGSRFCGGRAIPCEVADGTNVDTEWDMLCAVLRGHLLEDIAL